MNMLDNVAIKVFSIAGDTSVVTEAFTQAASEMKEQISTIAPIGIGVLTAGLVVTFGVKFFKRITGKA